MSFHDENTPPETLRSVANSMLMLAKAVERIGVRLDRLEGIERRLNLPVIGLLAAILATLLYTVHRLP